MLVFDKISHNANCISLGGVGGGFIGSATGEAIGSGLFGTPGVGSVLGGAGGYVGGSTVDGSMSDVLSSEYGWLVDPGNVSGQTGKGDVAAPQMSPQEAAYLGEITALIQEQREYNDMMQPIYAHQMHYRIGDDGQWTPMSDEEWLNDPRTTQAQREQWEIASMQRRRYKQALAGEIPLTEQMKQQKAEEWEQLKGQYGLTGETADRASAEDTIGVQALDKHKKRWALLEEAQRHGELGAGTQRYLQTSAHTAGQPAAQIGTLHGLGTMGQGSIQNYASLLQPYQAYNQMGFQAQAAQAANQSAQQSSLMGLGGMLGAAAIASGKDAKKNIKKKSKKDEDKALEKIKNTPSYEYNYKKGVGLGPQKNLGTIAEESPSEYIVDPNEELGFYELEQQYRDMPGQSAPPAREEDFYALEEQYRQMPGKSAPPVSEEDFYALEEEYRQMPGKSGKPRPPMVDLGNKMEFMGMGMKSLARRLEELERRTR